MKKFITTLYASLLFLPQFVFAQFNSTDITSLIKSASKLINRTLIPVLISLALIYLIYSVVQFIGSPTDSQQREEKKQQIFWGVIGLFVIVTIWALVMLVGRSFGIFAGGTLQLD